MTLLVPIRLSELKRGESSSRGEDQSDESSHVKRKPRETLVVRESRGLRPAARTFNWLGLFYFRSGVGRTLVHGCGHVKKFLIPDRGLELNFVLCTLCFESVP